MTTRRAYSSSPKVRETHHPWRLQCPVGTAHHTWSGVIGQQGTGKCNSNGILLLHTCNAHELVSTNTGPITRKNQDWFDENDEENKEMLPEKNRLHRLYQLDQSSAAFTDIRRTVQTRLRKMQDSWLAAKADEIQKYADTHDSKRFFDALKAVYGSQSSNASLLLNVDGTTLITDKPAILNRWAEHFSAVLTRTADINAESIARLPQVETNTDLDRPSARKKSRMQSSNSLLEKPQVQIPSLPKYTSMVVRRCYRS